jgi:HEPN domain-containing protein
MEIEQKLKQLSKKYEIPEKLLKDAIALEKERIMYANRQCVPKLLKAISQYSE